MTVAQSSPKSYLLFHNSIMEKLEVQKELVTRLIMTTNDNIPSRVNFQYQVSIEGQIRSADSGTQIHITPTF